MMSRSQKNLSFSVAVFSAITLAHSVALADCPPSPGPNETITILPTCCDYALALHPCGVDPQRIELTAPLVTPLATVTPDAGNPNRVHVSYSGGSMTVTSYGACIGLFCGAGPKYNWTPFRRDQQLSTSTLSWTRNYPSSAWIGGDPNYVDLTQLTPSQCSVKSSWSMGNNAAINLTDQSETFSLGCTAPVPKPPPIPPTASCPIKPTPSAQSCKPGAPDPVDPYSGDYYYAEEDLAVPGIIPLKVVRAYTSSQSGFTGPFGVGSYLKGYNYAIAVPVNGDGTVNTAANQQVQLDDGSGLLLPLSNGGSGGLTFTNNSELGTAGSTLVLSLDGSNHLAGALYTTPDKTKLHFDANGRLSSLEDVNGNTIALSRDAAGRLITVGLLGRSLTLTYNAAGLIEQIEDHTGRKVKYQYSAANELLRVINPSDDAKTYTWDSLHRIQTVVDYTSNVRFLNYYAANGMIKQQALKMGGSLTTSGIYLLDAPDTNVRVITDPNGNKTTYTYNSHGLLTEFKDGLNHADTTTYSANLFNGNPAGRYIEMADALSHLTHVDLNANNLPTAITDALNQSISITYDAVWPGKPATITNARGKTTSFSYDAAGNLSAITDANGKTTKFTYNGRGQALTVTNPLGKTITYSYNSAGDLLSVSDALGYTTTMTYDNLGRMTGLTDANGHTTQYDYDVENRLTLVTDPYGKTTEYSYNNNGQIRQIKDKKGYSTFYTYDRKGRLTQVSLPGSNSTNFIYDKADRLTKITDDVNNSQNLTYDAANRLTQNQVKQGSTTQYTYTYAYDNANRLITLGSGGNTWTYSYDVINRLTGLVSPQGTVGYEYSPTGFRTRLTATGLTDVTYGYDNLDRLTGITQGAEVYSYTYDDNGRVTGLTRPNGVNTSYSYDDADRLIQIRHLKAGTLDDQYDYGLDNVGNILTESRDGGTRTYTYDALDRLVQMDKTVAVAGETLPKKIEYTYDFNGNLTQRKDTADDNSTQTTGYTYNTANYLTQMTPPVGSAVTYTYNGYGALTNDSSGRSFTWDGLQRLTQMTAGGVTTSFSYDPMGRRTALSRPGLSKTFFYDEQDLLSDGVNTYLNGPGLDNPLRMSNGSTASYYLQNQIGSVTRLSNASGASVGHYQYLPYGGLLSSSAPVTGNPFTFTAREDDGTGLMYYRARYYDPALQVFISQDPLGDSQRYVGGNPTGFTDPLGLQKYPGRPGQGTTGDLVRRQNLGGGSSQQFSKVPGNQAAITDGFGGYYNPSGYYDGVNYYPNPNCPTSLYSNTTNPGSRYQNIRTDLTPQQFGQNLQNAGWSKTVKPEGVEYSNGGARYFIRNNPAKSTGGPTADYYRHGNSGRVDLKIRLEP